MLLVQFSAEKKAERAVDFFFSVLLRPVLQHSVIIQSKEGDRSAGNLLQHSTR